MKDFNLKKFLLENPLRKNKTQVNEAFEGFGGVIGIAPIHEAPIQPKDFKTTNDPWGWEDNVKSVKDDEENRANKWIANIDRYPNPYKDWSISWEYPGIIVWAHPDIDDAVVAATPGWDGQGTPIEFQSAAGSSQMLKVLDQDEFPSFNAYVKAVAPYLDMVEDANVNPTDEKMPKGSEEFQGIHEKQDYLVKGDSQISQIIVRIEDSVETIEDVFDQMIADPRKNIRGLAEYGHQAVQDIKQILSIREEKVNETMTASKGWEYDDEDFPEEGYSINDRMEGLVNQRELAAFGEAVMNIAQDLDDNGFDAEDIKAFLIRKLNDMIIA